MNQSPHITETEWLVMRQLWEKSPLSAAEIVNRVQTEKPLVATTVKTLLRRLIAKDAVGYSVDKKNSKLYYYYPLVTEESCATKQRKHFVSLYYNGSFKNMVAAFMGDNDLSHEELEGLRQLLDEKRNASDG